MLPIQNSRGFAFTSAASFCRVTLLSRLALRPPGALHADKGIRQKLTCAKRCQIKYIQQDAAMIA
jgi:hypothetical protein